VGRKAFLPALAWLIAFWIKALPIWWKDLSNSINRHYVGGDPALINVRCHQQLSKTGGIGRTGRD